MLLIDADRVLPQLPEEGPADLALAELFDLILTAFQRDINCLGRAVDQMELLGHRLEREETPLKTTFKGIQNLFFVQVSFPLKLPEPGKIGFNRLGGSGVAEPVENEPGSRRFLLNGYRNPLPFQPENPDEALCRRIFPFPVAAPGGLQDRIQPRLFPPGGGEIDVDPCLNQRGGHHPAGQFFLQPVADLLQLPLAVGGAEQRRQAVAPLPFQQLINPLGGGPPVDDAEHLRGGGQLVCQRLFA